MHKVLLGECFYEQRADDAPVHENDTSTRVNAIKKILSRPVVFSAFASIAVHHFDGSVMSKAPKKEMANTTKVRRI